MFNFHGILADGSWISNNWGWLIAAGVVVLGLGIFGPADTRRFSFKRTWAISSVCFAESIRKRILWITPLAIVGVIGITQFQRAFDEQDAVRQSVKICLFATGLVVVLTTIILACTNIPKEIESRVVYTVMTKPVTRLELVLGKVIGFSRVALAMVLIMGVFTWIYMRITSVQKQQQIAYRLNEGDISDTERARLGEYQKTGLLTARSFWTALFDLIRLDAGCCLADAKSWRSSTQKFSHCVFRRLTVFEFVKSSMSSVSLSENSPSSDDSHGFCLRTKLRSSSDIAWGSIIERIWEKVGRTHGL